MSKELLFVQCELHHEESKENYVVWIPEIYAIKGRYINIKNDQKIWEKGWKVNHIYTDIKKTEEEAKIDAEAWKHQREVSDI